MIKKRIIVEKSKKIVEILQDCGFSYADVNKMLRNKDVKINGKATKTNILANIGDNVVFFYTDNMIEKKFEIIFENDDAFVIYKKPGIESDGEKGVESALPGAIAVHRLDRNTEGLMVFAKNLESKKKLDAAFKNRTVHKFYLAEVVGRLDVKNATYTAFLQKNEENKSVKIFKNKVSGAVEIQTKINTERAGNQSSLVSVELLTGKMHQIRAHLAFLGHPIIGDGKYCPNEINKKFNQNRQKLGCFKLKFDFVGIEGLNFCEFVKYPKWFQVKSQ